MNCSSTRDKLLACERPDRPDAGLSRHLAQCDECRVWLRRLVKLERQIARLPVVVPPVPASLFDALEPVGPLLRPFAPAREGRRESGRKKLALASALAAALLMFAVGWWAWPHLRNDPSAPSATAYHARRDARLAAVKTPPARARVLIELAAEFLADVRTAPATQADHLALHLDQLLIVDLPEQAQAVANRNDLQPLLNQLSRVESEAARLAAESRGLSPRLHAAYERMADSARMADRRLRAMLRV